MFLFQRQAAAAKARAKAKAAKRRARKKRARSKKPYDPAKVRRIPATPSQIEQLVALSKGRVPVSKGQWFYKQFIGFSNGLAKSPEQVRSYLEKAYWVEEDDILQQIKIILWMFESHNSVIGDEYFKLAQALRVYLIRDEKIFRPDRSRVEAMYQYELELNSTEEPAPQPTTLDIVFTEHKLFSTFDKYIIYLYHCLGQTEKELARTLHLGIENAINIKRSLDKKIKESEEYHGTKNSERYSQPTFAIFTNR